MKSDVKKRILEAAGKLFSEKGYSDTTTREIAKVANVNEVSIFRHFGTKEGLFREFVETFSPISCLTEDFDNYLSGDLEHDLIFMIRKFLDIALKNKRYMRIAMMESPKNPELKKLVLEIPRRLIAYFTEYFDSMSEKGLVPKLDYKFISMMMYSAVFQYALKECGFSTPLEDFKENADEFVRKTVMFFMKGIKSNDVQEEKRRKS